MSSQSGEIQTLQTNRSHRCGFLLVSPGGLAFVSRGTNVDDDVCILIFLSFILWNDKKKEYELLTRSINGHDGIIANLCKACELMEKCCEQQASMLTKIQVCSEIYHEH
jgi:hypothetical protein